MNALLLCLFFQPALQVPEGFEVSLVAGSAAANDIHCMAAAPQGGIVVSGRGYVRLLDDAGKKLLEFAGAPKDGAMGLLWDKDDLYCVGDGGLKVWRAAEKSHRKPPALLFKCRTGGEHSAHAVRRGPDGWLYLMGGDGTGIAAKDITGPRSPVKDPVGGCVLRFSPDGKLAECYAHGFRNAYGMDFGCDGELYAFDSDNERCVGLPWYEPTRFYRVPSGGFHGWLGPKKAATWRMPPYFFDVVPPLATLGRGSPTGVVVYKHAQFPPKYRGGAFLCDWTFGTIRFVKDGKAEAFLKATGEDGFAPTAAAVHPRTGDLLVSIGGRGTRGAVYRIRHLEGFKSLDAAAARKLRPAARAPLYPAARPAPVGRLGQARSIQIALDGPPGLAKRGTVWEGYSRNGKAPIDPGSLAFLRSAFPSGKEPLDAELARTLAMIEDDSPAVLKAVAAKLTRRSHPTADVHYLACLARLKAPRAKGVTARTVRALLTLDPRLDALKQPRESNWPPRLAELHAGLAARDPALDKALLASPLFGHPGHAVFARAKGFDRARAARLFLKRKDLSWNAELVRLAGALPAEESLPVLRKLWGEAGLDEELLPLLARHARAEDYPRLLGGLASARPATVRAALAALEKMPAKAKPETEALLAALRQLPAEKAAQPLRERLLARLRKAAGHEEPTLDAWAEWAAKRWPDLAAKLRSPDGVDGAAWKKRLAGIDWDKGDPRRGAKVFVKASCAACHSGAAALGPDLAGAARRFSRDDLFAAIIHPSKDVPPRYRTTRLLTTTGLAYQGIVVYEAFDRVILQTGPATTIRLASKQVASKRLMALSLMPTGLLDRLGDAEIADLHAHLRAMK